jgi:NitT/TauT family transport system ATP-binding protein
MVDKQPLIEARQVEKFYGSEGDARIQVIAPTDLAVYPDEILALLGPSGSGKSTLMRMLTGLTKPSAGQLFRDGKPMQGACEKASIVFQSFALFPWLTVLENVTAPLKALGMDVDERTERGMKTLDTVGLDGFEHAYPKELSGGMKQRVGFARALVVQPEVLFMDEPFSALDVLTAENLRSEVIDLWQDKKMSTRSVFIVTHNIEEAVLLADRIIVLGKNPGRIRTDFRVELPRPHDRRQPAFARYVDYIYRVLTQPDSMPSLEPQPAGRKQYQMLPHARPGGISGFLEILQAFGGREDTYKLADELGFDLDDFLPIVEAATLLGFIKVEEGDAEITPEGRKLAEGDIDEGKKLFREATLAHVPLMSQITRALAAKPDHTVSDELFRDLLDEHFSEEEVDRQLDTVLNWARFSELFDYDAKTNRFFLEESEPLAEKAEAKP